MKVHYIITLLVVAASLFLLSFTRPEIAATSYDIVTGCGDEGLQDLETVE